MPQELCKSQHGKRDNYRLEGRNGGTMDQFSKEMEKLHNEIENIKMERAELQDVYNQADICLEEFYRHIGFARE
jgi:hypothetical protein